MNGVLMYIHVLMRDERRKKERSKQRQTNKQGKATQRDERRKKERSKQRQTNKQGKAIHVHIVSIFSTNIRTL